MLSSESSFVRRVAAVAFLVAAMLSAAKPASAANDTIRIEDLGKGTVALHGPWQFHPGDDRGWAAPELDDSGWTKLSGDVPWGQQGFARYTGFGWYRCHLALIAARGVPQDFSLLIPRVYDAYEVYWNGVLIGRNGQLPPHPVWYYSESAQVYPLGRVQDGVLAIRVWKAPLLSDDAGTNGGFESVPMVGSPEGITNAKAASDYEWLRSKQFTFGESLLYALVAVLSLLLWLQNRSRWPLFWMAGYAIVSPAILLLLNARLLWPYRLVMGADQPLAALRDISLWFLLLWLLPLRENRHLVRLTRVLAWFSMINTTLDGVLVVLVSNSHWSRLFQTLDAISAISYSPLEVFPLLLLGFAYFQRKRMDLVRWVVAILAFLNEMIGVLEDIVKQGRQYTGWTIAAQFEAPLLRIGGSAISIYTLTGAMLLVSIVYAVYHSVVEDQRRQTALEREKLELLRAREQMRHHAEHDGLTGLWNHRIIVERLEGELERSRRDKTPLSVILTDIDHFKKINDTYGHTAGDMVLKEISTIFTRCVRSYDWVGRYGGEEFLLILPGSELGNALSRAEELRAAVESARIEEGETQLRVTASFGVASDFGPECEAEAVIRIVDEALYRAKGNGRNRVVAAEMDVEFCEQ